MYSFSTNRLKLGYHCTRIVMGQKMLWGNEYEIALLYTSSLLQIWSELLDDFFDQVLGHSAPKSVELEFQQGSDSIFHEFTQFAFNRDYLISILTGRII
jgi:hypothetical protein